MTFRRIRLLPCPYCGKTTSFEYTQGEYLGRFDHADWRNPRGWHWIHWCDEWMACGYGRTYRDATRDWQRQASREYARKTIGDEIPTWQRVVEYDRRTVNR